MTTITTGGRTLAIATGVAFTFGGLRIILGDALTDPSRWTTSVQLTVLMVFGTIAAGHLMRDAWQAKHWVAALGFLVLFLAGTGLVVFNSVGRQAESSMLTEAQADDAAERRVATKVKLAKAERMLSETMDKIQADCVNGRRSRAHCDGLRTTRDVYDAAVKGNTADLARIGPQKPVHAKAAEGAKIAALLGADEAKAKAALMLVEPFLWTLFFEVGSIVSLGFAFRRRPATLATIARQPSPAETAQTSFHADDIEATRATIIGHATVACPQPLGGRIGGGDNTGYRGNPGNGGGNRPTGGGNRQAFEADVLTRLALGQTIGSQDEIAAAHGVHKGVASKWLKDMRERGLIPAAQRVGRCHRLAAAN